MQILPEIFRFTSNSELLLRSSPVIWVFEMVYGRRSHRLERTKKVDEAHPLQRHAEGTHSLNPRARLCEVARCAHYQASGGRHVDHVPNVVIKPATAAAFYLRTQKCNTRERTLTHTRAQMQPQNSMQPTRW